MYPTKGTIQELKGTVFSLATVIEETFGVIDGPLSIKNNICCESGPGIEGSCLLLESRFLTELRLALSLRTVGLGNQPGSNFLQEPYREMKLKTTEIGSLTEMVRPHLCLSCT